MTATDEIHRLLDERGVEWKEHRHVMPGSMAIQRETLWGQPTDVASGKPIPHVYHYRATEMGDGRLFLEAQLVTPEQAIAATVGDANLAAENQKLRELLADTLMQPRDYCQKYGIEYESWDSANDHLDARMRELGIEVTP